MNLCLKENGYRGNDINYQNSMNDIKHIRHFNVKDILHIVNKELIILI